MRKPSVLAGLTDEQVLKEFVKHFEVDGAILLYAEGAQAFGFTRWRNPAGRRFCKETVEGKLGYVHNSNKGK